MHTHSYIWLWIKQYILSLTDIPTCRFGLLPEKQTSNYQTKKLKLSNFLIKYKSVSLFPMVFKVQQWAYNNIIKFQTYRNTSQKTKHSMMLFIVQQWSVIFLARGLKSYKKCMWYANDSVGVLSLKLFYGNPFPFFLLHLLFPPPFIPFYLY